MVPNALPILYIHACALAARMRMSVSATATHVCLAVTPLSLRGSGTVYSILGLMRVAEFKKIAALNKTSKNNQAAVRTS